MRWLVLLPHTGTLKELFRRQTVPGCLCLYVSLCAWAVDRRWQVFPQEKGADTAVFVTPVSSLVGRAGITTLSLSWAEHIDVNICLQRRSRPLKVYKCLSAVFWDRKQLLFCEWALSLVFKLYPCVSAVEANSFESGKQFLSVKHVNYSGSDLWLWGDFDLQWQNPVWGLLWDEGFSHTLSYFLLFSLLSAAPPALCERGWAPCLESVLGVCLWAAKCPSNEDSDGETASLAIFLMTAGIFILSVTRRQASGAVLPAVAVLSK